MRIDYLAVIDFLLLGLEVFSRRDCGLILAGCRPMPNQLSVNSALARMQRQGLIERAGRGGGATFRVTPVGRHRAALAQPAEGWKRPWDGRWRALSYDLPERRRQARLDLVRALHDLKFGLLQRSLWIWPHPIEKALDELIEAQGIPECFCGFETRRLFLCSDAEIVQTAWNFKRIAQDHQRYLRHLVADVDRVSRAQEPGDLMKLAEVERQAFREAYAHDPWLPRQLWPGDYQGQAVERKHGEFRQALGARLKAVL